jgi:gamma-glutamyl-gamma-aminobutyrate hydrolase PuuD
VPNILTSNTVRIGCVVSKFVAKFEVSNISSLLLQLGCTPVYLDHSLTEEEILRAIDSVDGLILFGGEEDIHPCHYDSNNEIPSLCDECRDRFELILLHCSLLAKLPILGICRGMQIINIFFGGTLISDLPESPIKHNGDWDQYVATGDGSSP